MAGNGSGDSASPATLPPPSLGSSTRTKRRHLKDPQERLGEFGLELNEDKTRLIQFGRFDVRHIADGGRLRKKLQEIKRELRRRMHEPVAKTGEWLQSVLRGYYQYHAVPGNIAVLKTVRTQVARSWFQALAQRSQRRPTGKKLADVFEHWRPSPQITQEFPDERFDASRVAHPR